MFYRLAPTPTSILNVIAVFFLSQCDISSPRVHSQEQNQPAVKTPDPGIRRVQVKEDGSLQVFVATVSPLTETRVFQAPVKMQQYEYEKTDNKIELIDVDVEVTVHTEYQLNLEQIDLQQWSIPPGEYRAIDLQGRPVELDTLKLRFKTASPAIVSTFRDSVIDTWSLPLFKEDTVMFIAKSARPAEMQRDESIPPPAAVEETGTVTVDATGKDARPAQGASTADDQPSRSRQADFDLIARIVMNRDRSDVVRQTAIAVASNLVNDNKRKERLKAELHELIEAHDTSDSLRGIAMTTLLSLSNK